MEEGILEEQRQAKQAIVEAENTARSKITAKKAAIAEHEAEFAKEMESLRAELKTHEQENQGTEDMVLKQTQANTDAAKAFEKDALEMQVIVDEKQAKHDDAIAEQKERVHDQKDKIEKLRDLPIMLREVEAYDAKMREAEKYEGIYRKNEADLRRQHYVGSNHHKEEIFLLTNAYERQHSSNQKLNNRLSYGLRNPYL